MTGRPPPPPPGGERRAHPRFELVAQVEARRGGDVALLAIRDISAGGLFVELGVDEIVAVHIGDRLTVVLDLGSDELHLEAEAEVVRVRQGGLGHPGGFGLMWCSHDPHMVESLARILASAEGEDQGD